MKLLRRKTLLTFQRFVIIELTAMRTEMESIISATDAIYVTNGGEKITLFPREGSSCIVIAGDSIDVVSDIVIIAHCIVLGRKISENWISVEFR